MTIRKILGVYSVRATLGEFFTKSPQTVVLRVNFRTCAAGSDAEDLAIQHIACGSVESS
jgi:hypothetical protein